VQASIIESREDVKRDGSCCDSGLTPQTLEYSLSGARLRARSSKTVQSDIQRKHERTVVYEDMQMAIARDGTASSGDAALTVMRQAVDACGY